jgi:CRP-like cAMP-binding protein
MKPRQLFEHVPLFAGLNPASLDLLSQAVGLISVESGTVLLREQTPGNTMYVIAEGSVEIVKGLGTPEEVVLTQLQPADFFGEMSIVEVVNRSASVRAVGRTTLYGIKNTDLHHLFKLSPEQYAILILNLARDLSRRLRSLDVQFAARAH